MANLNVRIKNKFDTYENWMGSSLVLEAGEIAIASIPSGDNTGLTPPAIGVKVGDGSKTFSQLSWIQAIAGDVSSWAKAATKPEYKASEITGLADYISGEIQDTNTEYSFSIADNYKIKVQKKDVNGEYADYQSIDLTSAFAAKADKVANATAGNFAGLDSEGNLTDSGKKAADFATAAQGALADSALQKADITSGSANGTIAVEGTDVAVTGLGSAAFANTDAFAAAGHDHNSVYAAKEATEAHIANGDIHVTAEKKAVWDTAAEKAGANESAIKAIEDEIGEKPEGLDASVWEAIDIISDELVSIIDTEKTRAEAAEANLQTQINTIMNNPDAEGAINSINEFNQYVIEHGTIADGFRTDIDKNKADIAAMDTDYKAADTAIDNRLKAVEEAIGESGSVADDIAAAKQEAIETAAGDATSKANAAEAAAKDHADELNTAMNTRVEALEAIDHEHANKGVIDGITEEKVAAWDAAVTKAGANETAISNLDSSLSAVAKSGNVADLVQTEGDVLIFDCGTSAV